MEYQYNTTNTCARVITFDINDSIISNIEFTGGCQGNLKIIPKLIDGWTVEEIEEKCSGNICGRRQTSCTDQLAIAVRKAYEEIKK